jgi:predicted O-methyltransferase YrrM
MNPDELTARYATLHSMPETPALRHIFRETHLRTAYPNMLSGPLQGAFLRMISLLMAPSLVVEVGTFTGYSALCLAEGLVQGGELHTIERNPEMEQIIRRHLSDQGLDERIILHIGDALEIIPTFRPGIDLAYIDGEKEEYVAYYEALVPQMRPGGLILADNVLWGGKVIDPECRDKDTRAIRAFNEHVSNDPRTRQVLLPLRDGLSLIYINP